MSRPRKQTPDHHGPQEQPAIGAQPLVADQPIASADDDRLKRGGLVQAIVRTLERAPREGFVVGLTGPWGEGKTSVLRMVEERLKAQNTAEVVRFNPWMFSGSEDLLPRFFSELAATVELGGAAGQRVARGLSALGAGLSKLRVVPGAGNTLEAGGMIATGAANLLEAGTSLHKRQQEVSQALEELGRPIVVFVDDLDRLHSPTEIAEMVRLIRLVGDLPHVTYVLAYERTTVARALAQGDEERGTEYLEKIVQAVFELPPVRRDLLNSILSEAIDEAVGDLDERRFKQARLRSLQIAGLWNLFRNLRDIRRYASALAANVALVNDEVELSDVLALEALRLLEPAVFALIVEHVGVLTVTTPTWNSLLRGGDEADEAGQVQAIVDAARRKTIVRDLLKELFPAGGRHLGGSNYSDSFDRIWRRECRVANRHILTIYLERGLPSGTLSARDVEQALALLDDREGLQALVDRSDENQLMQLLARLEDYEGDFDLRQPEISVQVLASAGTRLRPRQSRGLHYDGHVAISRLLVRILRNRPPEEVHRILTNVDWPDLSSRAEMVRVSGHQEGVGSRLVDEAAAEELERELVDTVLQAPGDQLRDETDLGQLLWMAEQRDPQRTAARIAQLINDPLLLVRWLGQGLFEKVNEAGRHYLLPWSRLTKHLSHTTLAEAVSALDDPWLEEHANEREREAVRQAKHYAASPDSAAEDLKAFTGGRLEDTDEHASQPSS